MKRFVALSIVVTLVALPGAVLASHVFAAPGVTSTILGTGTTQPYQFTTSSLSIHSTNPSRIENYELTWSAGSRYGWHYHRALTLVTVTSGSLTVLTKAKSGCLSTTYRKGQMFMEKPGQILNVVDNSGHPAKSLTTIIGIPLHQPSHITVPAPAGCPK